MSLKEKRQQTLEVPTELDFYYCEDVDLAVEELKKEIDNLNWDCYFELKEIEQIIDEVFGK